LGSTGPNNYFTYRPLGKYLTNDQIFQNWAESPTGTNQALNGEVGTLFYLDASGDLTQTNTNNSPVYIQTTYEGDGIL
jgi:hypothetical protein